MRNFWALPAACRIALVLAAQHHSFSVNDDLLAYPQYQIQWSEDFISEELADTKLQHHERRSLDVERAENGAQDDSSSHIERYRPPAGSRDKNENGDDIYYEEMVLDRQHYLCAIPDVTVVEDEQGPSNDTLSKIEQERELARANERGWELISGMQGSCVYYKSGWWSYSFCYNAGVRQFHQLPATRGMPQWPPIEDPTVPGFSLGTTTRDDGNSKKDDSLATAQPAQTRKGELVVKGDTRYLVQRLDGGTQCDLTGDERKVEIQFHCNPSVGMDHISLIKELATCTYLMVIQTPRLCNDVAFLPPQKDQPNSIVCQPILPPGDVEQYKQDLELVKESIRLSEELFEQEHGAADNTRDTLPPMHLVGGIVVGGHNIVPRDLKLEKSAILGGKETLVATVARSDGPEMSKDDLKKLGLSEPKDMERLREKLNEMAGPKEWKLQVIDTPRGREYRGIIDEDADEDQEKPDADDTAGTAGEDAGNTEGSQEEFYKEEL